MMNHSPRGLTSTTALHPIQFSTVPPSLGNACLDPGSEFIVTLESSSRQVGMQPRTYHLGTVWV